MRGDLTTPTGKSSSSQILSAVRNRDLSVEIDGTSLVARLEVFKADRSSASLGDDEDATSRVKVSAVLISTDLGLATISVIPFSGLGLSVT